MEKRQATEFLEYLLRDRNIKGTIYEDALNIAIEALKAQLLHEDATSDLISRQAAIDALAEQMPTPYTPDGSHPADGQIFQVQEVYADCITTIKLLPTIQPETPCYLGSPCEYQNPNVVISQPEPQWILCEERMPEEHEWIGTKKFGTTISDEVYVTFENEKGERFCKHMTFQNGELSRYDKAFIEAWHKGSKPIAWMPLPEEYKPNK